MNLILGTLCGWVFVYFLFLHAQSFTPTHVMQRRVYNHKRQNFVFLNSKKYAKYNDVLLQNYLHTVWNKKNIFVIYFLKYFFCMFQFHCCNKLAYVIWISSFCILRVKPIFYQNVNVFHVCRYFVFIGTLVTF